MQITPDYVFERLYERVMLTLPDDLYVFWARGWVLGLWKGNNGWDNNDINGPAL